jgi:hypothetical protein
VAASTSSSWLLFNQLIGVQLVVIACETAGIVQGFLLGVKDLLSMPYLGREKINIGVGLNGKCFLFCKG